MKKIKQLALVLLASLLLASGAQAATVGFAWVKAPN